MFETKIDISHIPFSRYGAYAAIAAVPANEERTSFKELILLYAKLRGGESPIFSMKIGTDKPQEFSCSADPGSVTVKTNDGCATLYICDDDTIIIESKGLDFRIDSHHRGTYGTEYGENKYSLIINPYSVYATVYILEGEGKTNENGNIVPVHAGMSCYCPEGESHQMINDSAADLIFFAVVPTQHREG